jgi:hypothetical protein
MIKRLALRITPLLIFAALALGACADAEGAIPADLADSLTQGVELSLDENSIEFIDVVQDIAGDQWVVGTITLAIDASTGIEPGIAAGDTVRVHALLTENGIFTAREISLVKGEDAADSETDDSPEDEEHLTGAELEFIGTVEATGESSWTVAGEAFRMTPDTEIKDTIVAGDLVRIHAYLSETDELIAAEIELTEEAQLKHDDLDSKHDLKLVGTVESIDGDSWTIGGETFQVDPDAEIDQGIRLGDTVEVYLFLTPDGLTLVREISLFDDELIGQSDDLEEEDDDGEIEAEDDDMEDDDDHSSSTESEHSEDD